MAFETVLITNDDGVAAQGLGALVAAMAERFRVRVVAPDRERSGVGHAFTLMNPLRADEETDRFPRGIADQVYRCSGTPADCVKISLIELFREDPPDLVVSGINRGANMGPDVLYSGTVAAALEGLMNGVPSLATSLVTSRAGEEGRDWLGAHFGSAADWAVRLIDQLEDELRRGVDEGYCLNVNHPPARREEVEAWRWTDLARARYADRYVVHHDASGRPHYWLEGELDLQDERAGCDIATVRENLVSVTPLTHRIAHPGALRRVGDG